MGMTIVSHNLDTPLTDLAKVPYHVLREMGDMAVQMIRSRTERGIDVDGQAFQPLSEDYAEAKRKAGLRPDADLTVSGRMLNDMRATVPQPGLIEIRFISRGGKAAGGTFIQRSRAVGAADKAFYHHEAGAGKSRVKRKFFDLNATELAKLADRVRAYLQRL